LHVFIHSDEKNRCALKKIYSMHAILRHDCSM